jgi:hypothetical protein
MAASPKVKGAEVGIYTVLASVSGLRNGAAWPAAGESIELPVEEAASYVQFGYIVAAPVAAKAKAAEPVAADVAPAEEV